MFKVTYIVTKLGPRVQCFVLSTLTPSNNLYIQYIKFYLPKRGMICRLRKDQKGKCVVFNYQHTATSDHPHKDFTLI